MVDKAAATEALKEVLDPEIGLNIVELNMVKDVRIAGEHIDVTIALTVAGCPMVHTIKKDVEKVLTGLGGVASVGVDTTTMSQGELTELQGKIQKMRSSQGSQGQLPMHSDQGSKGQPPMQSGISQLEKKGIRNIIAVVSGKGGVGKSFVTSLLASELRRQGYEVGVLDADIPGPSIPKIFGLTGKLYQSDKGVLPALTKTGIKAISMNLMTDDQSTPFIWRGPIVTNIIRQLYGDIQWGELHFLLVDLPPGTSDAPLTVFQSIPLDGVIVVSTPQDLASMIVSKAINMAKKLNVPVLGLIENMSYLKCPHCDEKIEIYGKSRAKKLAADTGVSFLGSVPFDPRIAALSDEGKIEEYEDPGFTEISRLVRTNLSSMVEEARGVLPIVWSNPAQTIPAKQG